MASRLMQAASLIEESRIVVNNHKAQQSTTAQAASSSSTSLIDSRALQIQQNKELALRRQIDTLKAKLAKAELDVVAARNGGVTVSIDISQQNSVAGLQSAAEIYGRQVFRVGVKRPHHEGEGFDPSISSSSSSNISVINRSET